MVDLFAGLGGASAAFRDRGWDVYTVDIDPSFLCTETADLRTWTPPRHLTGADFVWASPPCTEFSRISMPWHAGRYPEPSMELVLASVRLIDILAPVRWAIENVRGSVRYIRPILGDPIVFGSARIWTNVTGVRVVKVAGHKERLSSRRRAERSRIPYAISSAFADAVGG